jgi:hypothetical protein
MADDQAADEAYGGPAAPETPEPEAQGFKICIYGTPGGALTFAVEPGGDEEAAAAGTPVRSLPELIKMVKETVQNGGGSPEASDAEFKAGLGEGEDE